MNTTRFALCFTLILSTACSKPEPKRSDRPQLTSNVAMRDIVFRSAALNRNMRYRIILPRTIPVDRQLPVAYLLHGSGEDYRSWSNDSDVARYAEAGLILVMPQGDYSYYVNAFDPPADRYEDYIVRDVVSHVEAEFPAANDRTRRAIVGASMGGFGAINLALRHPDLYTFVGALSPAIDAPRRSFSVRRLQQSWAFRSLFGPSDGETRRGDDPFVVARRVSLAQAPYIFLTCGDRESLLPPNREFADLLDKRGLPHEFHVAAGDHDWRQWNSHLPGLFEKLLDRVTHTPPGPHQ